jgi:hypothetical protein
LHLFDLASGEETPEPVGLCTAFAGQDALVGSAHQHALDETVGGMPDQEERRRHETVGSDVQFLPSMKRMVRSRASLSVNCWGGDFMK